MAPLSTDTSVRNLAVSSVEPDSGSSSTIINQDLFTRSFPEQEFRNVPPSPAISDALPKRSNLEEYVPSSSFTTYSQLIARAPAPPALGSGAVPPTAINMKGIQALFALIGASFVLGSIWFFFWAKNGGFQWRKGDWDDYKSTVLRRKGPDGRTLSNATKSTRLGGGSVVASGYSDEGMTELSSEAPIIVKEKARKASKKVAGGDGLRGGDGRTGAKNKKKAQKIRQQKEERWEGGFDDDVRAYRHEKPARVGGLNRDSDAQFYGTDYSLSHGATDPSSYGTSGDVGGINEEEEEGEEEAGSYVQRQQGGSNTSRSRSRATSPDRYRQKQQEPQQNHHHHPHIHSHPQRQQQQPQRQSRRDFSFSQDSSFTATAPSTHMHTTRTTTASSPPPSSRYKTPSKPPATASKSAAPRHHSALGSSYTEPLDFDADNGQGTKSYHHPIPGLSGGGFAGAGYRAGGRGRRDSLDDSD